MNAANKTSIQCLAIVKEMELKIGGRFWKRNFVMVENLGYDIILGLASIREQYNDVRTEFYKETALWKVTKQVIGKVVSSTVTHILKQRFRAKFRAMCEKKTEG